MAPPPEDWCGKCHPNLPPHKHQPDGSCRVLRADGTVCKFNFACWNGVSASELFASPECDGDALKLKRQMCEAGVVQCGSCFPNCPPFLENCCKRNCHTKLPTEEDDFCLMQKSDGIEEELKKQKFSSSSSKYEDWCIKCIPNLPPHKHQEDGSCLVKTTEGTEEFRGLTLVRADGTKSYISASRFFQQSNEGHIINGRPLPPLADMAALKTLLLSIPDSWRTSLTSKRPKRTGLWLHSGHLPPCFAGALTSG